MTEKIFVEFDNHKYRWRRLPSEHSAVRLLGGGELAQDAFNRFLKGYQTLFFGAYLDLTGQVDESQLVTAAHDAWLWLRFHVPTIATRIVAKDDGTSSLVYESGGIDAWVSRTFIVSRQLDLDLDAFRSQVGRNKVPSAEGDQTWGYLLLGPKNLDGSVTKFGFLIHTHHSPFDGNGLKIIVNKYLAQIARNLGTSSVPQGILQWGQEFSNLAPAVFNILSHSVPLPIAPGSSEEPSSTHPYYASLCSFLASLSESVNNPYGFQPRQADPGWPSPGREEILFTVEESAQIIAALKPKGLTDAAKASTLTHLAHAALAMTVIADNPPSPASTTQFINNLLLRDCRAFLAEPYCSPRGYPGYALGVGVVRIPVSLFFSDNGQVLPLDRLTLAKVTQKVRDLYASQQALPDPLDYMGLAVEIFCANLIAGAKANMLPPENGYMFSSDGISEKFLDWFFEDASGKPVFELSKHFLSLNRTDPAPFFRVTSWRGAIELSADFNSNIISADDVRAYLVTWKKFMLMGTSLKIGDF